MPQYFTVNTFGGLNQGTNADSVSPKELVQCDNMWGQDDLASSGFLGILNKTPKQNVAYKSTMPASGRARGIFQYFAGSSNANSKLMVFQCTTDYSVGAMYLLNIDANTWTTLSLQSGGIPALPYHADFVEYNNKVYFCIPGSIYLSKWRPEWTNYTFVVSDKSATPNALAGDNLTFTNGDATVTGTAGFFTADYKGLLIRKNSADVTWNEVLSVTNANELELSATYQGTTGAGGLGNSQYAALPTDDGTFYLQPAFLKIFKDKLFVANNQPVVGVVGNFSRIRWSVTTDFEDWSGPGSGYIDVGLGDGQEITGLGVLGEYLFVFKDFSYYVYRWTGDVSTPIVLHNVFRYGCVSHKTIQLIDINGNTGLIYFTGKEVRLTDGSSDVLISSQIKHVFDSSVSYFQSKSFFSLTSTDDSYYFSVYDNFLKIYMLFLPGSNSYYAYDLNSKIWTGYANGGSWGVGVLLYQGTTVPQITYSTSTATNQLRQLSRTNLDIANNVVLFSPPIDFGVTNKKKKIYWVEFMFHPKPAAATAIGTNTYLGFDWWDYNETKTTPLTSFATNSNAIQYNLRSQSTSYEQRIRKRFEINKEMFKFGWVLFEDNTTPPSGTTQTDGWGIIDITICYDIVDTI